MKLMPLELNTLFYKIDAEGMSDVVADTVNLLAKVSIFKQYLAPGTDEQDQLDEVEALENELEYSSLRKFSICKCSLFDSTQRRVDSAIHYLDLLTEQIKKCSLAYMPLSEKVVATLTELVDNVLAELSYFAYFQFDLDVTSDDLKEQKSINDVRVNVGLYQHLEESGKDLEEVLNLVTTIMADHRPQMTIFEEFPELEDTFYQIAGAYIMDFEKIADFVTADIVRAVITDSGDVEQIIKELERSIRESELED